MTLVDCGYPEGLELSAQIVDIANKYQAEQFSSGSGFGYRDFGFTFQSLSIAQNFVNEILLLPSVEIFQLIEV